jgi:hypothetical protein
MPALPPVTLTDKLKLEWPVMLTIVGGVLYLASSLGRINERLVAIETQLMALPSMQSQIAAQGERLSRLEALQK